MNWSNSSSRLPVLMTFAPSSKPGSLSPSACQSLSSSSHQSPSIGEASETGAMAASTVEWESAAKLKMKTARMGSTNTTTITTIAAMRQPRLAGLGSAPPSAPAGLPV